MKFKLITNLTTQISINHDCCYHEVLPDNNFKLKLFSLIKLLAFLLWFYNLRASGSELRAVSCDLKKINLQVIYNLRVPLYEL